MECHYFSFPNFSDFLNFLDFCQLEGREHDSGHTSDVCIMSQCRWCGLTLLSDAYDNDALNFREVFAARCHNSADVNSHYCLMPMTTVLFIFVKFLLHDVTILLLWTQTSVSMLLIPMTIMQLLIFMKVMTINQNCPSF